MKCKDKTNVLPLQKYLHIICLLQGQNMENDSILSNLCDFFMGHPNKLVTFVATLSRKGHKMNIRKNACEGELISSSYLTETYKQIQDGKRFLVYRLKPEYAHNEACIKALSEEFASGKTWQHPHILNYGCMIENEQGIYIEMEPLNVTTLEKLIYENPSFVTDDKEIERIINEVTEAVDYLHKQGFCHLNLHPGNIFLTKNGHQVKLAHPLFFYLKSSVVQHITSNEYTAPELFSGKVIEDPIRCDLYSLGCLIKYIYDMGQMPFHYRNAVSAMIHPHIQERPSLIAEFHQKVRMAKLKIKIFKIFIGAIALMLACAALIWLTTSSEEEEIHFITPTATETYIYDSIKNEGYYISDSILTANTEALEREQQKMMEAYDRKLNDIFKKAFRKKAEPIINEIYSRNNMDSEQGTFVSVSNQGTMKLQEIQEELSREYELDPIATSKVAALVIEELTRKRMSDLKEEK